MAGNVLVLAEQRGGEIKRATLEALGAARRIADPGGGTVSVLVIGPGGSAHAEVVGRHGADRLYAVDAAYLENYAAEAYAACVTAAVAACEAAVVLGSATVQGKDVIARATALLDTACASDLIEVEAGAEGGLRGRRPVYSGKAIATVSIPSARPAVATLRPNAFPVAPIDGRSAAAVETLDCPIAEADLRVRTTAVETAADRELDVSEASIVVSGGRGLKEPENFSLIRDLAGALGGAVGASRAVVDAGWIPHSHQVGQTGKVVSPNLYVACGISGAIQHLAGMSSSKVIVAVNKDAEAPIFKIADYGIVGDVFEVLPALTAAVKRLES